MEAIGVLLGVVALFVLVLIAVMVVAAVKAGKAVGRKVERRSAQARRAVEDVTLKARSYTQPGPAGRIAAVRLEVRGSLADTRQVLESGVGADPQLSDALRLLDKLDEHARELDGELRMLEREPDSERVATRIPGLRERAERIAHSADSLRWAAQDRAHRFSDDELARLTQDCETEAGALRHWAPADPAASRSAGPDGLGKKDSSGKTNQADRTGHPGLTAGGDPSAEEALGLPDPLVRIADRLRWARFKGSSGPSAPR